MDDLDALDLMQTDRLLSEDELAVRDRVRAFTAEHVLPYVEG